MDDAAAARTTSPPSKKMGGQLHVCMHALWKGRKKRGKADQSVNEQKGQEKASPQDERKDEHS